MIHPKASLISCLLTLALTVFACQAFAGELYLDAGAGLTHFTCTICSDDGTWVQTGLPHDMTMNSIAYRAGLGYRGNGPWSAQLSYVNLGTAKIRQDYTVSDQEYDPKHHVCTGSCTYVNSFHTHDLMEGVELTAAYTWKHWPIQPYVKLGAAGLYHRLTAQFGNSSLSMHGWIPSTVLGAGVGYGWFYAEANYYRGFGGSLDWSAGLPISKEQVVGFAGVRIPLAW